MRAQVALYLTVLVASVYYLTAINLSGFADDPGVGWHLATGQRIASEHVVPTTDTFLSVERPWISDQWLTDSLLFGLHELGGWPLLYGVGVVLFVAPFLLILFSAGITLGLPTWALLIAAVICGKLATIHFILRPVLMSFIFFSMLYAPLVVAARTGNYDRIARGNFLLLVPLLFALWANMHPSFMLGFALFALFVAAMIVEKFTGRADFESVTTYRVLLVTTVSALSTLLNPYGFWLHKSIASLVGSNVFMQLNVEWKPLGFSSPEGEHLLMIFGAIIFGLFFLGRRACSLFEVLSLLLFSTLAIRSARYAPYFAIVAFFVLATILSAAAFRQKATASDEDKRAYRLTFSLVSVVLIAFVALRGEVLGFPGALGQSHQLYPFEIVSTLLDRARGESLVVYNHPNAGGFLTWEGHGRLKPTMDDRNTLIGESGYSAFFASLEQNAKVKEHIGDARYALLRRSDLRKQCSPLDGLTVVQEEGDWVLLSNAP